MIRFRQYLGEAHYSEWEWGLPSKVNEAFKRLGQEQRDRPEAAMIKVQRAFMGGVLNPMVEHVGDLSNRLTPNHPRHWAIDEALNKIDRSLRSLRHPYGFDREFGENCKHNAEYAKMSEKDFMSRLRSALKEYVSAHSRLRVYNKVQWLAKESALAVGEMNWDRAGTYLDSLKIILEKTPNAVLDYELDAAGNPKEYRR